MRPRLHGEAPPSWLLARWAALCIAALGRDCLFGRFEGKQLSSSCFTCGAPIKCVLRPPEKVVELLFFRTQPSRCPFKRLCFFFCCCCYCFSPPYNLPNDHYLIVPICNKLAPVQHSVLLFTLGAGPKSSTVFRKVIPSRTIQAKVKGHDRCAHTALGEKKTFSLRSVRC